jgi:hypothetical protein
VCVDDAVRHDYVDHKHTTQTRVDAGDDEVVVTHKHDVVVCVSMSLVRFIVVVGCV